MSSYATPYPSLSRPATDPFGRRRAAIVEAHAILARAGVKADIVVRRPQWKPGDVVVIEYAPNQPYTYVRGAETWPVDKGREPKTDEYINRLYDNGQVRAVLQAGGKLFDQSRLA